MKFKFMKSNINGRKETMKMKKVLAAVMAGTMVMASAVTVSAETLTGTAWWDANNQFVENEVSGDGTWTYTIKLQAGDDGALAGGAFTVEAHDADDKWITTTSANDAWTGGAGGVEGTIGGNTAGGNGYVAGTAADGSAVDTYTVKVTRTGNDWKINYYEGTDTVLNILSCTGANLADDVTLKVTSQVGIYDVTFAEGDGAAASTDDGNDDSEAASNDDSASTDDTASGSGSSVSDTTNNAATTTTSGDKKTGDAAPIVAVAVALLGCGAIAFASKKRFVK